VKSISSCRELKLYALEFAARFQLAEMLNFLEEFTTALSQIHIIERDLKKYLEPDDLYNLLISKHRLSYNLTGDISHLQKLEHIKSVDEDSASLAKRFYLLGVSYSKENLYNKAHHYFKCNLEILLASSSNLNNIIMTKLGMLSVIYNTSKPLDCINYFEKNIKDSIPAEGYNHTKLQLYYILYNCYSKLKRFEDAFNYQELYLELLSKRKDQKLDFKLIKTSDADLLPNPLNLDNTSVYLSKFSNGSDLTFLSELVDRLTEHHNNIDLNVDFICSQLSMSRSKLFRKIKEYSDYSFSQMLNLIRIDAAVELFKEQKLTLSEIAYRCGFNSNSYFSKCFREVHSISPSDYRTSHSIN